MNLDVKAFGELAVRAYVLSKLFELVGFDSVQVRAIRKWRDDGNEEAIVYVSGKYYNIDENDIAEALRLAEKAGLRVDGWAVFPTNSEEWVELVVYVKLPDKELVYK